MRNDHDSQSHAPVAKSPPPAGRSLALVVRDQQARHVLATPPKPLARQRAMQSKTAAWVQARPRKVSGA
jgi:hypothetical protein